MWHPSCGGTKRNPLLDSTRSADGSASDSEVQKPKHGCSRRRSLSHPRTLLSTLDDSAAAPTASTASNRSQLAVRAPPAPPPPEAPVSRIAAPPKRSCLKADAQRSCGFIVFVGDARDAQAVVADGVSVNTVECSAGFGGFRGVPFGAHTIALVGVGTSGSADPVSLTVSLDPKGVVVLKLNAGALEEEKSSVCVLARTALIGAMNSNLLPWPSPPEQPSQNTTPKNRRVRIRDSSPSPSDDDCLEVLEEVREVEAPSSPKASEAERTATAAPPAPACQAESSPAGSRRHRARQRQWELKKLEDLFDDIQMDPESATLRRCYLEMIESQLQDLPPECITNEADISFYSGTWLNTQFPSSPIR
eukprot:m51a1_g1424 hypothetical protein (362) ;mRNA; f:62549-63687